MTSFLTLGNMKKEEIFYLIELAQAIKKQPLKYKDRLANKIVLMIFEKPSLRTRASFDVAVKQLGGDTTIIEKQDMPLGKESIEDTAKVSSRYYDAIVARLFKHDDLVKLAENSTIPVINGLTNEHHPVQILSDLLTIYEKFIVKDNASDFKDLKLCFLGDGFNNITHSLIQGCAIAGMNISVCCPSKFMPYLEIITVAKKLVLVSGIKLFITSDPVAAIKDTDIVYADSWMSYHVPKSEEEERIKTFMPYQINAKIVKHAKTNFIFMNCLPAMRGYEQTAEIIDGEHSIVFDQAENRLHMQKALLLWLLNADKNIDK